MKSAPAAGGWISPAPQGLQQLLSQLQELGDVVVDHDIPLFGIFQGPGVADDGTGGAEAVPVLLCNKKITWKR